VPERTARPEEFAVPRSIRPLIAGVAAMSLLLGAPPATADETTSPDLPTTMSAVEGVELPASTEDVTTTDTSLRSTSREVTVLMDQGSASPTVHKLRTETSAQAEQLAAELSQQPGVVAAPTTRLRAFEVTNTEPMAPSQWNLPMVGVPAAWQVAQGAGVVVAIIDTGVDATHPDLVGRVLTEIDLLPAVTPLPEQNGHGTRIAGIIAAGLNDLGTAGVAPQASILPVSALDPAGYGDSSTVARAIIAAADAGARVINLSLGGPDRDPVLDQACAYAFQKGAVVVAAGGNSYADGNAVQYPAASPKVIAVASVDRTGTPSAFSNTGSHIDIAAPGEGILAPYPAKSYNTESGTSFAAPHVSATAALVLSANPRLTATQVSDLVIRTAQDDISGNGRDDQLGQGVVRADRAVQAARALSVTPPPANAKLRLRAFDAAPEPARRGRPTTVAVTVQARYPNKVWRAMPTPTLVTFEFKRAGRKKYRAMAVVASGADGRAVMQAMARHSGRWRAKVQQPNGRWTVSKADVLKVRR
jgi:type VII secretion-associated serine protease mycosin